MMVRVYMIVCKVLMRMAFLSGSAKQTPDFVRSQIRNDFQSFLKLIRDAFDVVGLHYA